ncbi:MULTISPECIES: glycoside hydrolase family 3 protein [unclassified Streptomyces]|uniref:glycoside hydrolase family 3 protein n=1 Tax=unclassified Streptomyces TaxID=2593676 RepID=UPI002DD83D92|nr:MULTISPECIES: glycoside hydrolase family 3 protein [unclassified Streptomyces]WSA92453.1 glycoside hydrolase family 3 protein [Streptomyces sp. NBC_01795]WSB76819.1 glycoside hydrolase family 3 protein [Streptomyces sp. NBC_01775]WSS14908.1 glycoside hydrolase family 3 protein [Streptomyces sp. NBC_01186]WSS43751.1 glycoside hydrolase family 3 protein [Streptomyces sp. NBC_01187]
MTTSVRDSDTLTRDALAVLQPGFTGTSAPAWLLRRLDEGLASVGLFGRNIDSPEQLTILTEQLREVRPDVLVAIDEEGGDVTRLEARSGSSFPGNLALGHIDDPGLTRAVAHELGRRLAAAGVNLNWAPSADVNSNPDNPVIGVRSFGGDPELVARHTVAYVEGLQAAGVAACVKHFPGHGDTAVDSHHAVPRIDADLATLRSRELVPFKAAVRAGSKCVMSAHILLPALDEARPGTLSPAALTGLLRAPESEGGLGHQGLIVTDGMEMQAISANWGLERGSVLALAAGADAICVGGGLAGEDTVLRLRDALVTAVRDGELTEERLADAAARVRALAEWTRSARRSETGGPTGPALRSDPGIGVAAARRALVITGLEGYTRPTGPLFVAALTPLANIAVGDETPWGPAAELERMVPGTRTATYGSTDDDAGAAILAAAGERPVVAVVRDLHRHPWMAAAVDKLVAARADTVVVEMGVPQAPPRGALHVATHGAARVCGRAAAEVIAGG